MDNNIKERLRAPWDFENWLECVTLGAIRQIEYDREGTSDEGLPFSQDGIWYRIKEHWNTSGGPNHLCYPPKEWDQMTSEVRHEALRKVLDALSARGVLIQIPGSARWCVKTEVD